MNTQPQTKRYRSPLGMSRLSSLGEGLICSSLVMGIFLGSQAAQAGTIFNQPGPFTGDPLATTTFADSDALDLTVTDFTMSACVYWTQPNAGFSGAILAKRGSENGWIFALNGESGEGKIGAVKFRTSTSNADRVMSSDKTVTPNTWSHVAVVYQAGQAHIFVNGANDGNKVISHPNATEKVLRLGGDFDYVKGEHRYRWHGTLSNLRIDNTALSQAEIQTLCTGCGGVSCTGSVVTPDPCKIDPFNCGSPPPPPGGPTYDRTTHQIYIPELSFSDPPLICEVYLTQTSPLSFAVDATRLICHQ